MSLEQPHKCHNPFRRLVTLVGLKVPSGSVSDPVVKFALFSKCIHVLQVVIKISLFILSSSSSSSSSSSTASPFHAQPGDQPRGGGEPAPGDGRQPAHPEVPQARQGGATVGLAGGAGKVRERERERDACVTSQPIFGIARGTHTHTWVAVRFSHH